MNKLFPTALGLKVAIAISAGGVLVQHPLHTDSAPRAYGDITIAESDNQKVLPADKAGTPPQTATPTSPSTADAPPAVETTPGEESKGAPPRKP